MTDHYDVIVLDEARLHLSACVQCATCDEFLCLANGNALAAVQVRAMIGEATAAPAVPGLRRVLGSWGTAALSIGAMAPTLAMAVVGPEAARLVGRAAPLAFALAALLVLAVSIGFVRLSAEFASAGSVYAFVGGSVGPRAGAFTGATMLGTYLVFPWVSVAAVTLFGTELLHLAGLRVDWLVVALLGWLLVGGLAAGGLRPAVRALIVFEAAAVVVILALMAVVVRALATGTAPRGQRFDAGVFALPAGLTSGTLVLAAFAASATPLGALAAAYAGPGFAALLHAMALVSAVGAGLGCLLVAVRMLFALGRDRWLPTALARISPRTGAPSVALVAELTVGLALIVGFRLAAVAPDRMFFALATFGVLNLLVMYAVTDVAAVRHLRRTGARRGAQVLPLVGAVVAVVVFVQSIWSVPRGLLLVLAGWLALAAVFALVGRPRGRTP